MGKENIITMSAEAPPGQQPRKVGQDVQQNLAN